jgi:hypothetical protein
MPKFRPASITLVEDRIKADIPSWWPNTVTQLDKFIAWLLYVHNAPKAHLFGVMGRTVWPFGPGFAEKNEKARLRACFELSQVLLDSMGLPGTMAQELTEGIYGLIREDDDGAEWKEFAIELRDQWENRS